MRLTYGEEKMIQNAFYADKTDGHFVAYFKDGNIDLATREVEFHRVVRPDYGKEITESFYEMGSFEQSKIMQKYLPDNAIIIGVL